VCKDSPPECPKYPHLEPPPHNHSQTLEPNQNPIETQNEIRILQLNKLRERVQELTGDLNREKKDKEAVKSQAESLNREYDRLTEEFSKLQKKITIGGAGNKDD